MTSELIYSDTEGWWFWRKDNLTSQPFFDKDAAINSMKNNKIDWQE